MDIKKLARQFLNEVNNRQDVHIADRIVTLIEKEVEDKPKLPAIHFEIRFTFLDPWVDQRPYNEGVAIIYLTDQFYKDIDRISIRRFGVKPTWNNTHSIGLIYLKK